MKKRYWTGSLTDGWKRSPHDMIDAAAVMATYADDFVDDPDICAALRFNLYLNAVRRAGKAEGYYTLHRGYEPTGLPDYGFPSP